MQHMCLWTRSALPLQYPDCLVCRERRKQRFSDMEHVIDDLSAQLKQMSDIGNQNAMLQVCFPAAVRTPVRILRMVSLPRPGSRPASSWHQVPLPVRRLIRREA